MDIVTKTALWVLAFSALMALVALAVTFWKKL